MAFEVSPVLDPESMRHLLVSHDPTASAQLRLSLDSLPGPDRDSWLDSVLGVDSIMPDGPDLPLGCVPYVPCAVDWLLQMVDSTGLTTRDVFVDIGSGVGRAAALTHLLTGAGAIGLEIQARLVQRSLALAKELNAPRFSTIQGDAAELARYVPIGTVFFLYCPFSGARLERVIDEIDQIARTRQIRLCCVQLPVIRRPWLELTSPESADVLIYRSRLQT